MVNNKLDRYVSGLRVKSRNEEGIREMIRQIFPVIVRRGRSIDTIRPTLLHRFPHAIKLRGYDRA